MPLDLAHLIHAPEGAETRPPLMIAHGLFGAARNFNTLGKRLAEGRRVIAVDMRNHGASPWDARMDYPAMAEDLAAAIDRHAGGRAALLGHSMGGKAAMALALTAPERVAGLIVADIAPVAYPHSHASYVAAMRAVDLSTLRRRADAKPVLAAAVPSAPLQAFLLQNLVFEGGTARWRLNLDALAAGMPDLLGWPEALGAPFAGPALFLHGGASDYVGAEARAAIPPLFPKAKFACLEGAGHWLHADAPDAFRAAVENWLCDRGL